MIHIHSIQSLHVVPKPTKHKEKILRAQIVTITQDRGEGILLTIGTPGSSNCSIDSTLAAKGLFQLCPHKSYFHVLISFKRASHCHLTGLAMSRKNSSC